MGKQPMLPHGRRKRPGETEKRAKRQAARAKAWKKTQDGAGARTPDKPKRHHRQPRGGRT